MTGPDLSWLIAGPIAHRALHDEMRVENSISAFRAAIQHGYAIECDLQVSATGEPVVFHDPTLDRLTSINGDVRDYSPEDLRQIKLGTSQDGISTLSEHLDLVNGQVPLVLELKGVEGEDAGLVEGVASALDGYDGAVAVMSFDHWLCAQFAELIPNVPRGLTAYGEPDSEGAMASHAQAMADYDLQFVSYDVQHVDNPFVHQVREKGLPVITWTVRNEDAAKRTYQFADQMTFEGFHPPIRLTRALYV